MHSIENIFNTYRRHLQYLNMGVYKMWRRRLQLNAHLLGLYFWLICLTAIKESLSTYSTMTTTTTISPTNLLPYFDFDVPRNLTVTVGQTGFLHCRVERLGDKGVSWIRKRDLHILTAGSTTYTSDQRFQVIRPENSGNWTLQIKYPQPRDSGIYECQINTEPKMSLSYTFNVVELKANILGPSDLFVKSGSDINLTCRIMQGPHELGNIFWYKGTEIIDMTTNMNEIDSATRISQENDWTDGLTSRLKIRHANPSDTGNYTCVPTIAKSSSVYVHVIISEHPAAMQHNSSGMNSGNCCYNICCMLFFTILSCCLQRFFLPFITSTTSTATLVSRSNLATDASTTIKSLLLTHTAVDAAAAAASTNRVAGQTNGASKIVATQTDKLSATTVTIPKISKTTITSTITSLTTTLRKTLSVFNRLHVTQEITTR